MDSVDKMLDDGPIRLDGTQHAIEEKLRTFWSTHGIYDATRLKPSGNLVADISM